MRASGETDFPCITGERVGMGRSYVKLDGKLDYDAWCDGIRLGRCYVTDGRSHLMDFAVNGLPLGERGSELRLLSAGRVVATAKVAAYLPEEAQQSSPDRRGLRSWNLERAQRVDDAIRAGKVTPDLGGKLSTDEVTDAVLRKL